jgi:hypothetical protein
MSKTQVDYHLLMCLKLDNLIRNHHQSPNDTCTKKSRNQSNITNRKSFVCLPLNSYTRHLNVPTGNHITHQKNSKNKKNKNKKKNAKIEKRTERQTEREKKARRSAITKIFISFAHSSPHLRSDRTKPPIFILGFYYTFSIFL